MNFQIVFLQKSYKMNLSQQTRERTIKALDNKNILQLIALILRFGMDIIEFIVEHKNKAK